MAYTRQLAGPGDYGIVMGCSQCGFAYSYPRDIRMHSDGKYRCKVFCDDPTNDLDDSRARAAIRGRREKIAVNLPGAIKTGYLPDGGA